MIRQTKILLIAISLLLIYSCDDWLDVQPESEVVLEDFWQSESHVNQMLATCYKSLTEGDAISRMLVWGELRSDNVTYGTDVPDHMYKIINIDITPTNDYCKWGAFYTTINYCNIFLHYAPDVVSLDPNFTESDLLQLEAEVLTLRSLAYFYLIRSFKRIPWVDQPSIDDSQDYMVADTTEEYILSNILSDLNFALSNTLDDFDEPDYNKGRITKNAVRALLADIYLWQGDYNNCINACDQILEDDIQSLELVNGESVIDKVFFDGNSTESIFELQYDTQNWFNWVIRSYFGGSGNTFGY